MTNNIYLMSIYQNTNQSFNESDSIEPGDQTCVIDTPIGKLGLAICYDLRFPELFRKLIDQGAEVIAIPAAFTAVTGKAHWEILIRARAIENLAYVIAAGQGGYHVEGNETYGHSMIVDPWGTIQDQRGTRQWICDYNNKSRIPTTYPP